MTDCDETLTTLLFGRALDRDAAAHLAACPRCRAESAAVEGLERTLAAAPVPAPPPALARRVLAAAAPLLARNARRAAWPTLARAREGKMIAGVCAGLGEQFGVSVTILRLAFVLGTLVSGFMLGLVIYLVLWVVMPYRPARELPAVRPAPPPA